jgi:AraC-like DNA-binding protein
MPATQLVSESVRGQPGAGLAPLAGFCSGFRLAGQPPGRHRGLPSPYLTLIFTLDDPLIVAGHPDPAQPPGRYVTLAGGLHTAPALITHAGRQSGIQLGVSPLAARALFGLPAGELADLDVDGTDALGPLATEIQERLRAAATWPERFALLGRLLPARAAGNDWDGAAGGGGGAGRGGGHGGAGGSRFPGVSPEVTQAWRRLLDQARAGTRPALAGLAADTGYYDQAHLDREFRALAGCPPTAWLAEDLGAQATASGSETSKPPR